MKILLLESDSILMQAICERLRASGHETDCYSKGLDFMRGIRGKQHDVYILDTESPVIDGFYCQQELVRCYPSAPIIMISAEHNIEYIKKAFSLGCDDYLKKPFHLDELEIRINHLTKKRQPQKSVAITNLFYISDNYSFDRREKVLYFCGTPRLISKREQRLLAIFVQNIGIILSEDTIRLHVWQDEDVQNSSVRALISRFHRKLKENIIDNVWGYGYVLHKRKNQ